MVITSSKTVVSFQTKLVRIAYIVVVVHQKNSIDLQYSHLARIEQSEGALEVILNTMANDVCSIRRTSLA